MSGNGNVPQEIEEFLHAHGVVEFEYDPKFSHDQISERKSFGNQARLYAAVNEDRGTLIAMGMEEKPDEVSPIIVSDDTIVDGNHRFWAARQIGRRSLPAVRITQKLSETQLRILAYKANQALNKGWPNELEELLHHATWLVEDRGMSQSEAAREMGIPVAPLGRKLQRDKVARRMDRLGLRRERDRIRHMKTLERLASIRDDDVFTTATRLVSDGKLGTEDVNSLCKALNKLSLKEEQLAYVEKQAELLAAREAETAGGKVPEPKPLRNLRSILSRIEKVDLLELQGVSTDPETKKRLRLRATTAAARLSELAEAL